MKYLLLIAIVIGATVGLITAGVLITVRTTSTLTPYELEQAKLRHVRNDLDAWSTATAKGEQWSGTTEYVPPKPPVISTHPLVGGFVAGFVAALIAFVILLVVPFSSNQPHPDSARQPTAHRRLLPP